jgi:hypothetical protein
VRPRSKPSVEGLLEHLRARTERAIEKVSTWGPDSHRYYCPECFTATVVLEEEKPRCPNCGAELRPVDEYFKTEYARALRAFCEKASKIAERVWPMLESWPRGIIGYLTGEGVVGIVFGELGRGGYFNGLGLFLEGRGNVTALLGIFNMSERELDKLAEIIRVLREEGARGEVQVRADCPVPEEKLKSLGFEKTGAIWLLRL